MRYLDWRTEGRDWPLREHSKFVQVGPVTWHVQQIGSGPKLLLLHGTGASTHSWAGVTSLLADRFEVMAVDLPGHGFTRGRPPGGLTLPAIASSLKTLLAQQEFTPNFVAAHSAGAAIAVEIGVAPIVAFAPALTPMGGAAAAPFFSGAAKLLLANPFTSFVAAGAARHFIDIGGFLKRSTGSQIKSPGVAQYARLFGSPGHVEGALEMMAQWDLGAMAARLSALTVPVIIAHGDRDAAIPIAESRRVAERSGARLIVLPGLGHLAHEERPDEAARIIVEAAGESA